jgi:hypothetical protein
MGHTTKQRVPRNRLLSLIAVGFVLALAWHILSPNVYGAQLGLRSLQLSSDNISVTSQYKLSFTTSTTSNLGSIEIEFCSNDPFPDDSCVAPAGFSDSQAMLTQQTGQSGFIIDSSSTANKLILSRASQPASSGSVQYVFNGITNPSSPGSYFVRLQTFATSDATGPSSDYGGIAFAIVNELSIQAMVPPYLIFCTGISIPTLNCASATGDYIDFGELSSKVTAHGQSQMLAATNAQNGYNVTMHGTTLQSGNDIITAMASDDVSRPATSQFGVNFVANSSPSGGINPSGPGSAFPEPNYATHDFYRFNSGDLIVSYSQPDNLKEYTASYIVNVPPSQPAGIYVTTLTYICLANF